MKVSNELEVRREDRIPTTEVHISKALLTQALNHATFNRKWATVLSELMTYDKLILADQTTDFSLSLVEDTLYISYLDVIGDKPVPQIHYLGALDSYLSAMKNLIEHYLATDDDNVYSPSEDLLFLERLINQPVPSNTHSILDSTQFKCIMKCADNIAFKIAHNDGTTKQFIVADDWKGTHIWEIGGNGHMRLALNGLYEVLAPHEVVQLTCAIIEHDAPYTITVRQGL